MSSPSDSKGGGGMGMNMVTTVMAFSVSAFFVLFVFARLLCARLHLRAADHAAAIDGDAFVVQTYNVERGMRGLERSVVTSFPTVKFGDGPQPPPVQEESQCTVCLEEYAAKDVVRVLPACGHAFHAPCILAPAAPHLPPSAAHEEQPPPRHRHAPRLQPPRRRRKGRAGLPAGDLRVLFRPRRVPPNRMVVWRSWPKSRPPPATGAMLPSLLLVVVTKTILLAVRRRGRARAPPAS